MDDLLLNRLGRALVTLENDGPLLDDLLVPTQASSGENAGKPPNKRGSKPPLVVPIVDLKIETHQLVKFWAVKLAASENVKLDCTDSIAALSRWVRAQLLALEQQPWSEQAAFELIAQARLVGDLVWPPLSPRDPKPIEVGTTREIAAWCEHVGRPVSRSRLVRAIDAGELASECLPDGRVIIRLADALTLAQSLPELAKDNVNHQAV
ncbi:hypothetical protein [Corynebacterium sp.]|uniref:hypothetical protein n=1 Tax=Corynebacterium sp. TaxID=1720 RepID=UPI0028A85315|nr:hypothetical protein [Corynebacterium sp.]